MKHLSYLLLSLMLLLSISAQGQSQLYEKYAKYNNLEVAYIENFQLDSATHLDVTIIIAKNNFIWRWLLREFHITPTQLSTKNTLKPNKPLTSHHLINKKGPDFKPSSNIHENDYLYTLYHTHTMVIYHIQNIEQFHSIINHAMKDLTPNNKK